jgi:Cof subfamily protein (haloacid dehalogenase superfamily)
MTQKIDLIVVDIDGTLLNSKHELSERNTTALKAAIEKGVKVVLATGKTRASANTLIEQLGLTTPGIYNQGLAIYNPDGKIIYQKTLDPAVARQVITFAEDRGFDVVAYSGSRLLVRTLKPGAEELAKLYHEPMPEAIGALQNILDEMPINKLIILKKDEPRKVTALRWQLSMQLDGKGRLVQAMIPYQLEVLPPGSSKGVALKALLKEMNIASERVMAIGDGENDMEMVELAGIGVAVGDASQKLKDVADHVVANADDHGVADAVERFVLKIETPKPETVAAPKAEAKSENADGEKSE